MYELLESSDAFYRIKLLPGSSGELKQSATDEKPLLFAQFQLHRYAAAVRL
jgi:hypothetical protein